MTSSNNLKIATWNVCLGASTKLNFLDEILSKNNLDILFVQESEVSPEDYSGLNITNYNSEFATIEKTSKSRCMAFVKSSLNYNRRTDFEGKDDNLIFLEIFLKREKVKIAGIYRSFRVLPPDTNHLTTFTRQLQHVRSFAAGDEDFFMLGDFNLDENRRNEPYYNASLYSELKNLEADLNLSQLVTFPTWSRLIQGSLKQSILDHVYANNPMIVNEVTELSVTISDHCPIMVTLHLFSQKLPKKLIPIRSWKNYTSELLLEKLAEEDWTFECESVQDYNNMVEQKLTSVINSLMPIKLRRIKNGSLESELVSKLKKQRKNLFINAKRRKSVNLFARCKQLDKKINSIEANEKKKKIRNLLTDSNPRSLWDSYYMALNQPKPELPYRMMYENVWIEDPKDRSDAFAKFFKGKVDNIVNQCSIAPSDEVERLIFEEEFENFSEEEVNKAIDSLKNKTGFGYDNIPVKVLKDGWPILRSPYLKLMRKIYEEESFPEQWKTSRLLPLHKKCSKCAVENYRPIANLCTPSKIFELVMKKRLEDYETNGINVTGDAQHGFKQNRGTTTATRTLISKLACHLDEGSFVALGSLDLSAAFDVVNLELLLARMHAIGYPVKLITLLKAWLRDRLFYVEVEGHSSFFVKIDVGTIQGSILGPILFNIFISPLSRRLELPCFADDSNYLGVDRLKENAVAKLEKSLSEAIVWIEGSGLKVNVEKTEMMILHKYDTTRVKISLKNKELESKKKMKILGLTVDPKLEWNEQIDVAIKKSRSAFRVLKRIKKFFTDDEFMKLLNAFVYSRLYYAGETWLLPTLKSYQFKRLLSHSGSILQIFNKEMSYDSLHDYTNKLTPIKQSTLYSAKLLYDLFHTNYPTDDWINLQFNLHHNSRTDFLTFTTNNYGRIGYNALSNRMTCLNNLVKSAELNLNAECYKKLLKNRLL
jgi:exonuclease III